jgi:hypothetical protein
MGGLAAPESLHASERHSDGVGIVSVTVIHVLLEFRFQQLDTVHSRTQLTRSRLILRG